MLNEVKHLQELHSDFLRDVSLRSTWQWNARELF